MACVATAQAIQPSAVWGHPLAYSLIRVVRGLLYQPGHDAYCTAATFARASERSRKPHPRNRENGCIMQGSAAIHGSPPTFPPPQALVRPFRLHGRILASASA